jgi:hypothetical protein
MWAVGTRSFIRLNARRTVDLPLPDEPMNAVLVLVDGQRDVRDGAERAVEDRDALRVEDGHEVLFRDLGGLVRHARGLGEPGGHPVPFLLLHDSPLTTAASEPS